VASHQAWYAAVNSLLRPFWSFRADYSVIPWCTFTDPEVARVGLSEAEAKEQGIDVEVTRYDIGELDRAITDGEAHGFVKVLTSPGTDKVRGATVVGSHAGELIAEFVLAMKHGLGLNKLLGTIHVYPTMMEANRHTAGVWKRAHAPEGILRWLGRYFHWRLGRGTGAGADARQGRAT
jgi:pyruvate/2-oxoglutarate dehydrogenase complex dihydrolipoamide dehydrogenase (E3) component